MVAVFDRYPGPRSEMLLAVKLADFANDDGTGIYPSVRKLAEKTRSDERTVQRQIQSMCKRGWLVFVGKRGPPYGTNEYRIDGGWAEEGRQIATPARRLKAVDKPVDAGCMEPGRGDIAPGVRGDTGVAPGVTPTPPDPLRRSAHTRPEESEPPSLRLIPRSGPGSFPEFDPPLRSSGR